jgi:hypothetical protein
MDRFSKMYPGFRQPDIYFTIGCLNSGGTTLRDRVLIGTEIAAADKQKAFIDILQLNYNNSKDVKTFFNASKYAEKWK